MTTLGQLARIALAILCTAVGSFSAESQTKMKPAIDMGPVCGAVTPTSAVVVVRLIEPNVRARLLVSTNPALSNAIASAPREATRHTDQVVKLDIEGLVPDTLYHYAVEVNGHVEETSRGRFRSFPPHRTASFNFAFGNCLYADSPQSALYPVARRNPLFFLNLGDLFYRDIAEDDITAFRIAYREAFTSKAQSALYRQVPLVYIWDDHDFGPNDSDASVPGRPASRRAFDEVVPHYPMPLLARGPISQAFSVGRVRFILTDLRSERQFNAMDDGPKKTMMGADQLAWFKQELLESSHTHALVFWVSSVTWIETPRVRGDAWGAYAYERKQIANFIKENDIRNLAIIAGDLHAAAADDGHNADYSDGGGPSIPLIIAAPLDNPNTEVKGGPYSEGLYRHQGDNVFGWVEVKDPGDKIEVTFTARNQTDEEKLRLTFTTK